MKKINLWFLNPAVLVSVQLLGMTPATLGSVFLADYPQTQNGIDIAIALVFLGLGGALIL